MHTLDQDAALYDAEKSAPVARLAALNFLGEKTVVVAVGESGDWTAVLTPARRELPSQRPPDATTQAAAQTVGWIRTDALDAGHPADTSIIIRIADETLTITGPGGAEQTFPAGVGTPGTPTPSGVTGYIQARYLDPAQNQEVYPIQLTSLHSTAADEPYGGQDGGLIGIHYQRLSTGAVSHGCIRLAEDAITAVNAVPLGTPVTILP